MLPGVVSASRRAGIGPALHPASRPALTAGVWHCVLNPVSIDRRFGLAVDWNWALHELRKAILDR